MGKLKPYIVFIFCILSIQSIAADSTINFQLSKVYKGNFSNFSIDNLGNIYLITSSNQIKKLNQNFDSIGVFNDVKRFGTIYSIDVSNPLKILVYYKDFATILMLDRFLNIRNTIDLRQQNILQVKAIAQSYDNNIWLFDELDATLKKIDENGKLLLQSADFRVLFSEVPNPSTIIDTDGMLYLYNNKEGWCIFDYYGALKSKHAFIGWQDVQVANNYLIGRDSSHFFSAQPQQFLYTKIYTNINLTNAVKVLHYKGFSYILTKEKIEIYTRK